MKVYRIVVKITVRWRWIMIHGRIVVFSLDSNVDVFLNMASWRDESPAAQNIW